MAKKTKVQRGSKALPRVTVTVPPKAKAEPEQALVIPVIKTKALSKDIGPVVVAALAKIQADETQAKAVLEGVQHKRHDLQARLTLAIVKAATADNTIKLADIFSADKKAKMLLGNQIGIALGYREVFTVGEGSKAKQTISWSTPCKQYFPNADDKDKDSPEAIAKNTFRTNWTHRITQCIQTACGIMERKLKAEMDKGTNALRLSGPGVKEQFGAASVVLNEKQNVGEGKNAVKLKEKPSFTAIAVRASEAHGNVRMQKSTARATVTVDPDKAIQGMAAAFVAACEKLDPNKLIGVTRAALESVQSAVDKLLG